MPGAFVLINTEAATEAGILKELRRMSDVKEAHVVYGSYDITAKIEGESINKLREIVTSKIRRIPEITSTLTMIVVEGV